MWNQYGLVQASNPSTQEVDTGGSQIQTHPRYIAGHCLKKHDLKKNAKGIYLKSS